MREILKVSKVFKNYDGIQALRGVSFSLPVGKVLVVIGPNGAGKTTLLKILALLEKPDGGKVLFWGKEIEEIPDYRKRVTLVFQNPVFFKGSVYDNVAYGLKIRKVPEDKIEKRVRSALKLVNLAGFGRRRVSELSGGERQRVALARAIAVEPEVMLLDEPTANLDPRNTGMLVGALKKLSGKVSLVIASHHLHLARTLSDRVVYLSRGRIVEEGESEKIFKRPKHPSLRKFLRGEF